MASRRTRSRNAPGRWGSGWRSEQYLKTWSGCCSARICSSSSWAWRWASLGRSRRPACSGPCCSRSPPPMPRRSWERRCCSRSWPSRRRTFPRAAPRRWIPWRRCAMNDLRFALRSLRKSPAFTAAAVLTLALGIGANTATFSVVDGVLLRPAPFEDVGRLMMVWETDRKSGTTHEPSSVLDYLDFQQRVTRFVDLAAFAATEMNLTPDDGEPSRLAALTVSRNFFRSVGLTPLVGRGFTEDEDRQGGPPVVLIGEELWERAFARDPGIVGRAVRLNETPRTVVGVLPAGADFGILQMLKAADYSRGFADRGDRTDVEVWIPAGAQLVLPFREAHTIFVVGRLSPGASREQAQLEMTTIAADLEATYPENDARGVNVEPVSQVVFGPVKPALMVLLGAVALVLLVA